MTTPSMGLKISIPSGMANKLRETPTKESPVDPKPKVHPAEPLPEVSINLENLIGYKPPPDELDSIRTQLLAAMWTRYREAMPDQDDESDTTVPPPDFDRQVVEFFDTGVARIAEESQSGFNLSYPPSLQNPSTGELMSTSQLWQQIQQAPPLPKPFVGRLWKHLIQCSRTLFWKRDMAVELTDLIRDEQARIDYQEWTASTRKAKLDNLYSIRETMVHQIEMTKAKLDTMDEDRESQVQQAMQSHRRQQLQQRPGAGLDAFGTTELSFPDELQWLGLKDEPAIVDEDDWGLDDDSYRPSDSSTGEDASEEDDEHGSDNDNLPEDSFAAHTNPKSAELPTPDNLDTPGSDNIGDVVALEKEAAPATSGSPEAPTEGKALSTPFQQRRKRMEKSKRRKKQERRELERKEKQELLGKLEAKFRDNFTSKELILAQTMHKALEEKLGKIDELLDSLQDEVWEAEEEEENNPSTPEPTKDPSFSLLDQVLAMILGAAPLQPGVSPKQHFEFVQTEHEEIVHSWKEYFGRLPPPAGAAASTPHTDDPTSTSPNKVSTLVTNALDQRRKLGISDNDADDWDAVDDWDDLIGGDTSTTIPEKPVSEGPSIKPKASPRTSSKPQTTARKAVGLRPGGSLKP